MSITKIPLKSLNRSSKLYICINLYIRTWIAINAYIYIIKLPLKSPYKLRSRPWTQCHCWTASKSELIYWMAEPPLWPHRRPCPVHSKTDLIEIKRQWCALMYTSSYMYKYRNIWCWKYTKCISLLWSLATLFLCTSHANPPWENTTKGC